MLKNWKWSNKYARCIRCKTQDFKHNWKWLCTACYDKLKDKGYDRKKQRLKARTKYENKVKWTEKEIQRKREVAKSYYHKNKEVILAKEKAKRRLKSWLPCMTLYIWSEKVSLPFENLEKPCQLKWYVAEYEEWQNNCRILDIMREFYDKDT